MTEAQKAFNEVLDLIDEWQLKGRIGYCLPVIRVDLLDKLEVIADERRRDNCSICHGTGKISDGYEDWNCSHCAPLANS